MSGSGGETLPDVPEWWEALPNIWVWAKGYSECPKIVGKPSRMSASGRKALPDVLELSRDTPRSPGVVGGPPVCPGVVG